MSGRSKHKSRGSDRAVSKSKKKKSRRRSTCASNDCIIVNANEHSSVKHERSNSQTRDRTRNASSNSNNADSFIGRIKLDLRSHKLLGEHPDFYQNGARYTADNVVDLSSQGSGRTTLRSGKEKWEDGSTKVDARGRFSKIERRERCVPKKKDRGRRRTEERIGSLAPTNISNKSRKQRRSPSCSSHSSDDGSSSGRSSSGNSRSSSGTPSSTGSDNERQQRQRKKKKLAKKIKRAEKKRHEERRKCKKSKEKSGETVKTIKQDMGEMAQDRLLEDINLELADRAKAMAPMSREEWEKKQSVIRRVYDGETGRHRLIKGDGEILEEIVSRDRHMKINKQATKGDGEFFNARLGVNK